MYVPNVARSYKQMNTDRYYNIQELKVNGLWVEKEKKQEI